MRLDTNPQQYAETPDLVWEETKSIPCITLQKHAGDSNTKTFKAQISVPYPQGIIKTWK